MIATEEHTSGRPWYRKAAVSKKHTSRRPRCRKSSVLEGHGIREILPKKYPRGEQSEPAVHTRLPPPKTQRSGFRRKAKKFPS